MPQDLPVGTKLLTDQSAGKLGEKEHCKKDLGYNQSRLALRPGVTHGLSVVEVIGVHA